MGEERARCLLYRFFSLFFRPGAYEQGEDFARQFLEHLPETGDEAFDAAARAVKEALLGASPEEVEAEHEHLFIDPFEGPQIPLEASYYLDGKAFGPSLARLRAFLDEVGLARAEGVAEPEDHLALLLSFMEALIARKKGLPWEEKLFYNFLKPCVSGLAQRMKGEESRFFGPLLRFLEAFLALEERYFKET